MEPKDWARTVWLALVVVLMSSSYAILRASQVVSGQPTGLSTFELTVWSPATVLSVASVIFSFGVAWQTVRVHGKLIQDIVDWRDQTAAPALSEHQERIAVVEARCEVVHGIKTPKR